MKDIQNRIVGVVGTQGSGKSTWIKNHLRHSPRVFAFDPLAEFTAIENRFESVSRVEQFFQWVNKNERESWAARFVPAGDLEEAIEQVCPLIYKQGNSLFVCEEISLYTKPGSVTPEFGRLVRTGRHKEISFVWASQRPSECAKSITALTNLWVLFRVREPLDLEAISRRCGSEIANRVSVLTGHDYLIFDAMTRELVEDSPRILRVDDSRPAPSRHRMHGVVIVRRASGGGLDRGPQKGSKKWKK